MTHPHHAFLVRSSDGELSRKTREAMKPDDQLVFDGPDSFRSAADFQEWIDAQIKAAGGPEQWRELVERDGPPAIPKFPRRHQ
jgi:hypothetical protein